MKKQFQSTYKFIIAATLLIAGASSCKKEVSTNANTDTTSSLVTTATSSTIAVAAAGTTTNAGSSGTTTDSVYVIQKCEKGQHRDSVAASALPSTIQSYLTTNYSGYTFTKAFAIKDTTGAVKGYVVIINYNNKPVAIQFTADGTFVKVLEQREKGDLDGDGWHRGGRFDCRDGQHRDTVAINALPADITSYMSTNFASDTLVKAFKTADGGYLVISKNNGAFATLFTSANAFVKHVSLPAPAPNGVLAVVAETALPSTALSYLQATYPNYVFDKAFSVTVNGVLKGYVAVINANNTRYCVAFDASGNFVAVKTIW